MPKHWTILAVLLVIGLCPALAQDETSPPQESTDHDEFGLQGIGPRVGLGSDPDQLVAGVHFDLGEFAPRVWFQPDVVMGFGDDVLSLVGSAAVWYRFEGVHGRITPYTGGALAVGVFNDDRKGNDDTKVEFGLQIGGGGEWRLKSGNRFMVELRLDLGDVWDVLAVAGWTF